MGEKPRNIQKTKQREKNPRLVAFPSPLLRSGGQLFSGVPKHRKQAGPTLSGRGFLI